MAKKDIRGASLHKTRNILIALAVLALLVGAVLLAFRLSGYRRMEVRYISAVDGTEETVKFTGFVRRDGTLKSGKLFYGNVRAEVEALDGGLYKLTYSNGDVYEGEMDGLQRYGHGKMTYASGDTYEGYFENDRFHGEGTFRYTRGDSYTGTFAGGKKSGAGTYTWADEKGGIEATYVGQFSNDHRNGMGTYTEADGTTYTGKFADDLREDANAQAVIVTDSGDTDRYYGGYHKDVRDGFGYYFYANGDVYVGEFKNNNLNGKGIIYRLNGASYEGEFENGNIKTSEARLIPEEDAANAANAIKENAEKGTLPFDVK